MILLGGDGMLRVYKYQYPSNGLPVWGIVMISIGVLVIVGVVAWCVCKRSKIVSSNNSISGRRMNGRGVGEYSHLSDWLRISSIVCACIMLLLSILPDYK